MEPVRGQEPERTGSFSCPRSLVIGITGGIASGKTTVARMLEELGAVRISADEVVHDLLAAGQPVAGMVAREFGPEVLDNDGAINRRRLGELVFRDPDQRKRLESIVHPQVMQHVAERIDRFRRECRGVLVVEIPLLIEVGATALVDKVLVVTAEQEDQIDRLQKRYGISEADAVLRIGSQLPLDEKVKHADWIVSTKGTLRTTKRRVQSLWCDIQKSLALRC